MPITFRSAAGPALAALALAGTLAGPAAAAEPENNLRVLASAIAFNNTARPAVPSPTSTTVTLPLFTGSGPDGNPVDYVVTESSDPNDATARGVNYSPKLANALGTRAVQPVTGGFGTLGFVGKVDFSPTRSVVPGAAPNYFPPTSYAPGAVGNAQYSPLTTTGDGIVRDTPVVANSTGRSDAVVAIDKKARTVTLRLFGGFYDGHQVLYIPTEASSPLIAAIESSTYTPNLAAAPGLGSDDPSTSAREAIVPIVNGPMAASNQPRQGLNSALAGEGAPLNIIQEEPSPPSEGPSNYSPVWDITPGVWTRTTFLQQLQAIATVHLYAGTGDLASYASGPRNAEVGLNASGDVSLCPVIVVFPANPQS